MPAPTEIHQWVSEFNWDDDLAPMWEIVQNPDTEFATALLIYWRLEGPWLRRTECNSEALRLHDLVEGRLLSGAYKKRLLRYDPIAENSLSRVQVANLKRSDFPGQFMLADWRQTPEPDRGSFSNLWARMSSAQGGQGGGEGSAANRGQPAGSITNRASSPAGSGG
jgi:hypothetical protein